MPAVSVSLAGLVPKRAKLDANGQPMDYDDDTAVRDLRMLACELVGPGAAYANFLGGVEAIATPVVVDPVVVSRPRPFSTWAVSVA